MVVYLNKRPWIAIVIMLGMFAFGANLMAQNLTIKGKGSFKTVYEDVSLINTSTQWIVSTSANFPAVTEKQRIVVTDIVVGNAGTTSTTLGITRNTLRVMDGIVIPADGTTTINLNTAISVGPGDAFSIDNTGGGDVVVNLRGYLVKT